MESKIKKFKCQKRSEELKNGTFKLDDHAFVAKVDSIHIGSIFKYIGENTKIDDPNSKEAWFEVLDYDEGTHYGEKVCYLKLHELDEFGRPMTLAKIKKKYGEDSYRVKRFIELKDKYGHTYSNEFYMNEYVLKANLTYSYVRNGRHETRELTPDSGSVCTKFLYKFDENGYAILKDKPENYDPEFDNKSLNEWKYEGENIQYVGDWNIRNNYFQKYEEYTNLRRIANEKTSSYLRLPTMYSCFWGDVFSELKEYCLAVGMTEDDFTKLKEMMKDGYYYTFNREIKEYVMKWTGVWDHVKKFVSDANRSFSEAYSYHCLYGG